MGLSNVISHGNLHTMGLNSVLTVVILLQWGKLCISHGNSHTMVLSNVLAMVIVIQWG